MTNAELCPSVRRTYYCVAKVEQVIIKVEQVAQAIVSGGHAGDNYCRLSNYIGGPGLLFVIDEYLASRAGDWLSRVGWLFR